MKGIINAMVLSILPWTIVIIVSRYIIHIAK